MTRKRAVLMRDLPIGRRGDQVEVEWLEPPPGFAGFAGWIVYRQGRSVSVEAEDAVRLVDADDPEAGDRRGHCGRPGVHSAATGSW